MDKIEYENAVQVTASEVRQWLAGGGELALIDVREEGQFGLGHPLLASNIPYSRLEAEIGLRVPRLQTRIVLVDAGDGIAGKAESRLRQLGYVDVHRLQGGIEGWRAAGLELFEGTNVPSKAFAEILEVAAHTPHVSADELQALQASGADIALLDTRTPEEFAKFHVPGARSAPGVELVSRIVDLVPSPDTFVIVSCAGRTRSIIGAQALINAGIPNRVASLANGTQGWRLAGFELETSPPESHGPRSKAATQAALERAENLRRTYGIPVFDQATVEAWLGDREGRTTYLFDVRSREEYEAGHLPGAVWAPGGQLVQATDQWVAVRRARLVLTDDDGIRASFAAHWLHQLGWEVAILIRPPGAGATVAGRSPTALDAHLPAVPLIGAEDALSWLGAEGRIVSSDRSARFRAGHPEGAVWANRARLDRLGAPERRAPRLLVVGDDQAVARLLAGDLQEIAAGEVRVLAGGTEAWRQQGLPLVAAADPPDADRVDYLFWNHIRHEGDFAAMRGYLQWELDLPAQIAADGTASFRIGPASPLAEATS